MVDANPRLKRFPSKACLVPGCLALAVSTIFVVLLCVFFEPRWHTNDDIAMSMIAHGYGGAALGSPNLGFSNILWGYLVRLIPEINGVLGYSIASLSVLVLVGSVLIYALLSVGLGYVGAISVLVLNLVRPVLFPQFTINSGLLMLGAIVCWHLFERQKDKRALATGCLLAYCSYLVRSGEFLLVLMVAMPLLPWGVFYFNRSAKIAILVLVMAISGSSIINHQAFQRPEWLAFNELNPARAPFTDYGAGSLLKQRTDILERYGYSPNDLDLIGAWFFVDSNVANPGKLNAMLEQLGPLSLQDKSLVNGWAGIKALWSPALLPALLVALLLALRRPTWRVTTVWGLCVAAVFMLGVLGRPGLLRVYVPLVCLLQIAPFLNPSSRCDWFATGVILVAALINTSAVICESKKIAVYSNQIRQGLKDFPTSPVVVWGGVFPFETVYPVLKQSKSAMSYQLVGLGVFTLAPFSVASAQERIGHGITKRLVEESGVPVVANEQRFGFLGTYCKEHLNGELKEISRQYYGQVIISWRRCEIKS
ncbi:MAG: hypothetical protein ACRESZ_18620 [Methylococcales bacterium]